MRTITRFPRQTTYTKMLQNPKKTTFTNMCQKEFTFIENDLTMVSHSSLFTKRGVCYGSGATIVSHNTRIFIHLRANYSIEYSLNLFYTHHLSRSDTNVSNEISVSA